jgi:hypothetical protein
MGSRWNPRRTIGLLLVAGTGVLLLADYGRELIAVDRCLDAGNVFDYREGRCRDDVTHRPHIPYAARHSALLAGCQLPTLDTVPTARRGSMDERGRTYR